MNIEKNIESIEKKSKMATEQDAIIQSIALASVEAPRVVIQAMAVMRTDNNDIMQNVVSKISRPFMQQPKFNSEAEVDIANS